jgi:Domain of unknown function (DUF1707)/2TM domain
MNCVIAASVQRPHPTADPGVRVGDREREKVISHLGQAFTQGYLSIPDYETRIHLAAYLAASLLMIGIWLAVAVSVGAWYFWPVWPILGMGIGVVSHTVPVHNYLRSKGFRTTA